MNKYIKGVIPSLLAILTLSGCNDFLDEMPDNRTTLDSVDKIKSFLVSAYPYKEFAWVNELSSDNSDDIGILYNETTRWMDDTFNWRDESETMTSSLSENWESCFEAISSANEALIAIDNLGGKDASEMLSQLRGEALLCRAYNHFILVNLFCRHWTSNAANDLGLPYMDKPETSLRPSYQRGNLADFYEHIERDLIEGISLVDDSYYDVPKYHFNQKAAYAFAARFYLYTEKWDKVVEYADKVLGSEPKSMLRDWASFVKLNHYGQLRPNFYIDPSANCNLLLQAAYSFRGAAFGRYSQYSRYAHTFYLAYHEDVSLKNVWEGYLKGQLVTTVSDGTDKRMILKSPYAFEFTDPVAGIGYPHTVVASFTADETLLCRAEAYTMLKKYDEAAADIDVWVKNIAMILKSTPDMTPAHIKNFYESKGYCYDDEKRLNSDYKKHLNPSFEIDEEGSMQECMLQCVLAMRRIETLHDGLRWFDIKRYGIEIPRRICDVEGEPDHISDFLTKDDLRRVYQIPQDVRDAGFQPNPR